MICIFCKQAPQGAIDDATRDRAKQEISVVIARLNNYKIPLKFVQRNRAKFANNVDSTNGANNGAMMMRYSSNNAGMVNYNNHYNHSNSPLNNVSLSTNININSTNIRNHYQNKGGIINSNTYSYNYYHYTPSQLSHRMNPIAEHSNFGSKSNKMNTRRPVVNVARSFKPFAPITPGVTHIQLQPNINPHVARNSRASMQISDLVSTNSLPTIPSPSFTPALPSTFRPTLSPMLPPTLPPSSPLDSSLNATRNSSGTRNMTNTSYTNQSNVTAGGNQSMDNAKIFINKFVNINWMEPISFNTWYGAVITILYTLISDDEEQDMLKLDMELNTSKDSKHMNRYDIDKIVKVLEMNKTCVKYF